MAIITNPDDTYDHVCESDRELPKDDPARTVYQLAVLSGRQQTAVMNAVTGAKDNQQASVLSEVGRLACRGWTGLIDSSEQVVEFAPAPRAKNRVLSIAVPEACDPELWESLPFAHRKELAEQVLLRVTRGISEDDRKNS